MQSCRNHPAIVHIAPTGTANPDSGIMKREWGYGSREDPRFVHFGFEDKRVELIFIGNNE